ncbi:MAG TPA: hypothetical protein QGF37_00260 [Candidatus Pelagibacter bacterium]|jgi:hypothetical protein|nr:hypothetical protein [Pelagibacteraceae bacterium]HJN83943.1 hypothetical protein [Candidatus Pelagibacter bacterium]|tara:strand:+ start:265 stop:450 length:186 start_codon:yes stop_codon:yes gene_type:complete
MEFRKKSTIGLFGSSVKMLIKIVFIFITLLLLVVLVDKINFPYPNKKIEKIVPNENLKVVK